MQKGMAVLKYDNSLKLQYFLHFKEQIYTRIVKSIKH